MKIVEILEGDIVSITNPKSKGTRAYGDEGYTTIMQRLQNNKSYVDGTDSAPTVRPMKRYTLAEIIKGIKAVGFPENEIPRGDVSTDFSTTPPTVRVNFYAYQLQQLMGFPEKDKMYYRWEDEWRNRMAAALLTSFGHFAKGMRFSGMANIPTIELSDDFSSSAGKTQNKPRVENTIKAILKVHNIGGLLIYNIRRGKSNYNISIQGAEIIDDNSHKRLEMDLQKEFGSAKLNISKEIENIGHRSVGPGLANYRIALPFSIKNKYTLS